MSLPLPSNSGNAIDATPSNPSAATGAINRRAPVGLFRSAQATILTKPTDTAPALGPATNAQPITDRESVKEGITYVGSFGSATHQATPAAEAEARSAGKMSRSASTPRSTSTANSETPKGTPYAAAMPAPAPQATSNRRCSSDSAHRSDSAFAIMAPACFGAPSRPSDAPIPP